MKSHLRQSWPAPSLPKPIVIIGAGGIVRDAHLPAYRRAGFNVCGIYDSDPIKSRDLAEDWEVPTVFESLQQAVDTHGINAVYDLALPPDAIAEVLEQLKNTSTVLIQKPMGVDLDGARAIRQISQNKHLTAAVNFQLRFSPMMLAAVNAIDRGMIGDLLEIDVEVNIFTPWQMFPFLAGAERIELSLHSIHYLDMIRALVGDPFGVFCRTMADPRSPKIAQARTSAILDYGEKLRVLMNINHNHPDKKFQRATFRIEGTDGEIIAKMGVLYDYPQGEPDELWIRRKGADWQSIVLEGTWFPDAFIGKMSNVQRFDAGEDDILISHVDDAFATMALVEACFDAHKLTGVAPAQS